MLNTLSTFIQPVALTVVLIYVYGAIGRWRQSERTRSLVLGVLFGAGVIMSMSMPITLAEGLIFDLRNLLVGIAFAFLGPLAGLVSLVAAVAMRLFIGGQGAMIGVMAILVSAAMGFWWHRAMQHKVVYSNLSLVALGLMISAHVLVGVLLSDPFRTTFFVQIVPVVLVCNVFCAWLLGRLILRERLMRIELSDLRTAAETDPLTNLLNRRSLIGMVETIAAEARPDQGRVMLYFDVDHFKAINDKHGHIAGDKVLKCISERVNSCLRPGDIFARLGGDEFVVLLPAVTPETAQRVADRCRAVVSDDPIAIDDRNIHVSISMGGTWSDRLSSFDSLLQAADEALYQAKGKGRNQVCLDDSFPAAVRAKLAAA